MFVVPGPETFGSSVDFFLVSDFLECLDGDLSVTGQSQEQFQVFLESVRLFLGEDWKWGSVLQNLF